MFRMLVGWLKSHIRSGKSDEGYILLLSGRRVMVLAGQISVLVGVIVMVTIAQFEVPPIFGSRCEVILNETLNEFEQVYVCKQYEIVVRKLLCQLRWRELKRRHLSENEEGYGRERGDPY